MARRGNGGSRGRCGNGSTREGRITRTMWQWLDEGTADRRGDCALMLVGARLSIRSRGYWGAFFRLPLSTWPFITFLSADLPSETPSSFNLSKPLRGDLTPPTPLSSFAATPLVERGEPERASFLAPPLHAALRSNAELERGAGGVRSVGRCAFRDVMNGQLSTQRSGAGEGVGG